MSFFNYCDDHKHNFIIELFVTDNIYSQKLVMALDHKHSHSLMKDYSLI